ncbi:MAG: hypothetical protein FWH14_00335 [Oscillospiraceae bacterium]|nr:hypothetical protein [Oscillospiraceae bacterium]
MKKLLVSLLALSFMLVVFAGCNTDNGGSNGGTSTSASDSVGGGSGDAANQALLDYIDANNEIFEAMATDALSIKASARGNSLVFSYQGESLTKEIAEMSLEMSGAIFEPMLEAANLAGANADSVIVEYLDGDGNVLASEEYGK